MLLSYAATDRYKMPADAPQPLRCMDYFAYIISDHFKTLFHSFFLPFPMIPWNAAIAADTKRAGRSSFGGSKAQALNTFSSSSCS